MSATFTVLSPVTFTELRQLPQRLKPCDPKLRLIQAVHIAGESVRLLMSPCNHWINGDQGWACWGPGHFAPYRVR